MHTATELRLGPTEESAQFYLEVYRASSFIPVRMFARRSYLAEVFMKIENLACDRLRGETTDQYFDVLDIVIEGELIGMWPKADRIDFLFPFVLDVRSQHLFGEDISLQEKRGIFLQRVQGIL